MRRGRVGGWCVFCLCSFVCASRLFFLLGICLSPTVSSFHCFITTFFLNVELGDRGVFYRYHFLGFTSFFSVSRSTFFLYGRVGNDESTNERTNVNGVLECVCVVFDVFRLVPGLPRSLCLRAPSFCVTSTRPPSSLGPAR